MSALAVTFLIGPGERLEDYALRRYHETGDVAWLETHERMVARDEQRRRWREAKRRQRARKS